MICAAPRFVAKRLVRDFRLDLPAHLQEFEYGSWAVANLHLRDRPAEVGFPMAWDNVGAGEALAEQNEDVARDNPLGRTAPLIRSADQIPANYKGYAIVDADALPAVQQLNRADTLPRRLSPGQLELPGLKQLTGAPDYGGRLDLHRGGNSRAQRLPSTVRARFSQRDAPPATIRFR